ncbi:MAG: hypothetical protein JW821_01065, partial [Deltaproteobacteria bacterium]|nr:hypothetical protein [Deltaproteobacteria bacterium]
MESKKGRISAEEWEGQGRGAEAGELPPPSVPHPPASRRRLGIRPGEGEVHPHVHDDWGAALIEGARRVREGCHGVLLKGGLGPRELRQLPGDNGTGEAHHDEDP